METGPDLTNLSQVATRDIDYSADNMPVQLVHSVNGTTNIVSDGDGARVKKSNGSSTTIYVGGHYEIENGVAVKYIFAGNLRVAMINPSDTYYFHKDHLGSSTAMTKGSGSDQESTEYTPYGLIRFQTGTEVSNYNYTDQELDPETGLYNYNARLYDPTIGLFISADTIVPDYSDPQTLNRYMYARGNPLIYVDPSGHLFGIDDLTITVIAAHMAKGAAIGAGIGGSVAAVTGGDIGQGMLTGAISGAFFGGVGSYTHAGGSAVTSATKVGLHTAAGAISGGVNSAITGGDIGIGALTGGIAGGLGMAFGKQGPLTLGDYPAEIAKRSLIGGITGGIASEMYGGSFGDGFRGGAQTAAIGASANCFGPLIVIGAVFAAKTIGFGIASWGAGIAAAIADGGNLTAGKAGKSVNIALRRAKPIVYGSGAAGVAAAGGTTVAVYGGATIAPYAKEAFVSLNVTAGSPQGQKFISNASDFITSALPATAPIPSKAGLAGKITGDIWQYINQ